jgi:UDP-3-O-[3-hydroxymyristoyl] glucosamine N-acyltransferase
VGVDQAGMTSADVAKLVGGSLIGAGDVDVHSVASLADATAHDVSFLGNEKYRPQVLTSAAGVVLLPRDFDAPPPSGRAWILCDDPSSSFSCAVMQFAPPMPTYAPGKHPSAVVAADADVHASAHVGPCAVIESGAAIGENSVIGAGVFVGENARLGGDCFIHPNVTIREWCVLGERVIVHSGTTIGSDGFGFIPGASGHEKVPQVGIVQIDDDVEVGAQVAIDRARFGRTWIQRGVKIDNLVQIAHNVVIGEHCFIVAQVGVSGSSNVGRGAILAGQVGVAGHLEIGPGAVIMGQSGVTRDVPAGATLFGTPAISRKEFAREKMLLHQCGDLRQSVKALKRELAEIRAAMDLASET